MPELTREQAVELFDVWLDHHLPRLIAERDKTLRAVLASIDEAVRINGSGQPFVCPCGAGLESPRRHRDDARAHAQRAVDEAMTQSRCGALSCVQIARLSFSARVLCRGC
jgi:hypothetical protein